MTPPAEGETLATMDRPDYVGLALYGAEGNLERGSVGGRAPEEQTAAPARLHIGERHPARTRIFLGLKGVLRPLVVVLYLFPLLLVAKIVLWALGILQGDLITVLFVGLVVLVFFLLALLVLLYPFVGPPSTRSPRQVLDLGEGALRRGLRALGVDAVPLLPPERLNALCEGGPLPEPVRVRGRLTACHGHGAQTLLRDAWLQRAGQTARLVVGRTFALLAPGQPPVVVDLRGGPWLAARHNPRERLELEPETRHWIGSWLVERAGGELSLDDLLEGPGYTLEAGVEVELVAPRCEVVRDIDDLVVAGRRVELPAEADSRAGSPYRQDRTRPGLLVTSTAAAPAIIRMV